MGMKPLIANYLLGLQEDDIVGLMLRVRISLLTVDGFVMLKTLET